MRTKTWGAALSLALIGTLMGAPSAGAATSLPDATITGTVTQDGHPVAGASVGLVEADGDWVDGQKRGRTDSAGRYTVTAPRGAYRVLVSALADASPYLTTYAGGTTRLPDATTFTTRLGSVTRVDIPVLAAGLVQGFARDRAGKPLAHTSVTAIGETRYGRGEATTDASGHYTIGGLPPGTARVFVDDPSSSVPRVVVHRGRTATAPAIRLRELGTVTGVVKGVEKGATVPLDCGCNPSSAVVGAGGKVVFRVPAGTYRLKLGNNAASHQVRVGWGGSADLGTVTVPKASRTITGVVRDAKGKPVRGADVRTIDAYGVESTYPWPTTDAKGRYRITGVAAGTYTVHASRGDREASAKVRIRSGKRTAARNLLLALPPAVKTYTQTVTVVSGGVPVQGVSVSIGDGWGSTNANGKAVVAGIRRGTHEMRLFDPNIGGYVKRDITIKVTHSGSRTVSVRP